MTTQDYRRQRVGVVYGGLSSEREVSLRTGQAIYESLVRQGYDAALIDADRDLGQKLSAGKIAVVFNALHGRWGEDGCVQGLLEVLGIPYSGSGVGASAVAMNKIFAKRLFEQAGLPTPDWHVVPRGEISAGSVKLPFPPPVVVKPGNEGSSVGVTIARTPEALDGALQAAAQYAGGVLVERYIKGREIQVAVLNGRVLGAIEVRPAREFYDYAAKYESGDTAYLFPAPISSAERDLVQEITAQANALLGCRGVTRSDLILAPDGKAYLLEVNTLPGMTATSLVPKIAAGVGLTFDDVVAAVLADAGLKG